jgi:transposase
VGLCLEKGLGFVTRVPRTCAVRHELEVWGQQQPPLPLLIEKPGRTRDDACRRWHGQSVIRQVEVEDSEGHVAQAALRFVVVHSSQLAQQQTQTHANVQTKEAEAITDHIKRVEARQFACLTDAEAAKAEYEGRGQGRRGRRPRPWRYHTVRYRIVSATRRTRRARRGRPAKTDPPPMEPCYHLSVAVTVEVVPEEENGWIVLATTGSAARCADSEILQAYQEQNTTVEPGFRWSKNPAAISPVWLEKPERIAALAMRTVVGLLVYSVIQRQVRLHLRTHHQQVPGNKGKTATPTAAVVFALFASVAIVQLQIEQREVQQVYGMQSHHLLVGDALGLDDSWYAVPAVNKNGKCIHTP